MAERVWPSRLRWRVRGAWQWPAFAIGLAIDAALLQVLPIAGRSGPDPFPAILLAGALQLIVVAAGARVAGSVLRRVRPTTPKVVADDRAGAALLVALSLTLLGIGLAHRPAVVADRNAFVRQQELARAFVLSHAPPAFRASFGRMDTWQAGPHEFRTCAPRPDGKRAYCVYVFTDVDPPRVVPDQDRTPNAKLVGPENPARRGR